MNRIISEDIERILEEDINWDRLKGRTILLTGASGMLGSYIMSVLVVLNKTKGFNMKLYGLMRNPGKLNPEIRSEINVIQQSVVDSSRSVSTLTRISRRSRIRLGRRAVSARSMAVSSTSE